MTFRVVFDLFKRNVKLLFGHNLMLVAVICAPLLTMLVIGSAFTTSGLSHVSVSLYENGNDISIAYLNGIVGDNFKFQKMDSLDKCVNSVKTTTANICMAYPQNFDITKPVNDAISFYVDNSRQNLVWALQDTINQKVAERAKQIGGGRVKTLLSVMQESIATLEEQEQKILQISNSLDVGTGSLGSLTGSVDSIRSGVGSLDISDISGLRESLQGIAASTSTVGNMIGGIVNNLPSCGDPEMCGGCGNCDSANAAIMESVGSMEGVLAGMGQGQTATMGAALDSLDQQIIQLGEQKRSLDNSLIAARQGVSSLQDDITGQIAELGNSLDALKKVKADLVSVNVRDEQVLISPLKTEIIPVVQEKSYFYFIFPSIVVIFMMFMSILLSSIFIITEKKSTAFFRNMIAPIPHYVYLLSVFLTILFVMLIQIFLIFVVASSMIGPTVNWLMITLLSILMASVFVLIGMNIGFMSRTEENIMFLSFLVAFLMLFVSSIIIPLESMGTITRSIAAFNPLVLGETVLRNFITFELQVQTVMLQVLSLIGFVLVFATTLILLQKRELKKL